MTRLLIAALPQDPGLDPEARQALVSVRSADLRSVLALLKRIKNRVPADGCVVCHHKDREHLPGCLAPSCHCDTFIGIESLPFDMSRPMQTKQPASSPDGGCFSHPIWRPGKRWCDGETVATVVVDREDHPDWRACRYHADQVGPQANVVWDEGEGPRT
jgi:hypothetical protein